MTTDLICINDTYSEDYLKVFAKHGIQYPKKDEVVELIKIDKLPLRGKTGLIVAPYNNQFIKDVAHGVEILKEVSFDKLRFVTLNQEVISEKMLKEIKQINYV